MRRLSSFSTVASNSGKNICTRIVFHLHRQKSSNSTFIAAISVICCCQLPFSNTAYGIDLQTGVRYPVSLSTIRTSEANAIVGTDFGVGADVRCWVAQSLYIEGAYTTNVALSKKNLVYSGSQFGLGYSLWGQYSSTESFQKGAITTVIDPVLSISGGIFAKSFDFSAYFPSGFTTSQTPKQGNIFGGFFAGEIAKSFGTNWSVSLGISYEKNLVAQPSIDVTTIEIFTRISKKIFN